MNKKIYETDLYNPIKKYFEKKGYTVRSEVKNCDITAVKGEEIIIIELKKRLNVELLTQAIERQKLSDKVYIAVPKIKKTLQGRRKLINLMKKLELGLIFVSLEKYKKKIDILIEPGEYKLYKNNRKRKQLLNEANSRSGDYNKGGSSKKKIITAYREKALFIAYILNKTGDSSPKEIKKYGTDDKTGIILYKNFYGWYIHKKKGVYSISETGKKALIDYSQVIKHYKNLSDKNIK